MAQSRKKAIMEQVDKQRRRNRAISLAAIVIIAIIIVTVVLYPRATNAVQLPSYLDRCISNTPYHYHPGLKIVINGSAYTVPPDVGRQGSCFRPLHTHPPTSSGNQADFDGTIHIETDENREYHLGDFFLIWGNFENNANMAIFNSNQIFTNHVVAGHTLNMTVNGQPNSDFQNLLIPTNAGDTSNSCTVNNATPAGGCQPFDIIITYA